MKCLKHSHGLHGVVVVVHEPWFMYILRTIHSVSTVYEYQRRHLWRRTIRVSTTQIKL